MSVANGSCDLAALKRSEPTGRDVEVEVSSRVAERADVDRDLSERPRLGPLDD